MQDDSTRTEEAADFAGIAETRVSKAQKFLGPSQLSIINQSPLHIPGFDISQKSSEAEMARTPHSRSKNRRLQLRHSNLPMVESQSCEGSRSLRRPRHRRIELIHYPEERISKLQMKTVMAIQEKITRVSGRKQENLNQLRTRYR